MIDLNYIREYPEKFSELMQQRNVNVSIEKILKFLRSFNLTLVHIHGNNFAERDLNNDITVLELTFSKNPVQVSDINILPNKLMVRLVANQNVVG